MAGRKSRAPSETEIGRLGLRFEVLETQNKQIIEMVSGLKDELFRAMDERFAKIEMRLDVIEAVVRKNSEDIRKNSEDIQRLWAEVNKLRVETERIVSALDRVASKEALDALEVRVLDLERHLGLDQRR